MGNYEKKRNMVYQENVLPFIQRKCKMSMYNKCKILPFYLSILDLHDNNLHIILK